MIKTIKAISIKDVDGYLAEIPEQARITLLKLRHMIQVAAPKAEEKISYQIPVFKYQGMLVGFAAYKNHCSFFVMSPGLMRELKDDLKEYDTDTATIRFPFHKPLSATLVKKIVKARIKENEARVKSKLR